MELSLPDAGGVTWSVAVHDLGGMPLGSLGADLTLRTASVGKVLLLVEAARALVAGEAAADEPLTRSLDEWVGDSGLWHTLSLETLPLADVAALVGAVSDNLATNVLLRRIGLDAVAQRATMLGLRATALHDRVRDERTSDHAETLSTGSAAELVDLVGRLASGTAVSPEADRLVRHWLSANVDQTMVGSAFVEHAGLDPIAHHALVTSTSGLVLWNKTGTDTGVRADIGAVTRDGHTIAWGAIANWEPPTPPPPPKVVPPAAALPVSPRMGEDLVVWSVLRGMRHLGEQILDAL